MPDVGRDRFVLGSSMLLALIFIGVLPWVFLYFGVRVARVKLLFFLPDALVVSLVIFAGGAVWLLLFAGGTVAQEFVVRVSLVALVSASIGGLLAVFRHRRLSLLTAGPQAAFANHASVRERRVLVVLFFIVVLMNVAFLVLLLANTSLRTLYIATFTNSETTLLAARKLIATGTEGYFAPGLIKQVRDILMPVLVSAVILGDRLWYRRPLLLFGIAIALVGMMLSGQRYPMLVLFVVILVSVLSSGIWTPHRKSSFKLFKVIGWAVLALAGYTALTVLLGRIAPGTSPLTVVNLALINLFERIFIIVPFENIKTYYFWQDLGPTWGQSWLADLSILLPGTQTGLSNQLHSFAGGSTAGNAPLALPVDSWFAWGLWGVAIAPGLFAFFLGWLDYLLTSRVQLLCGAMKNVLFFMVPTMYSPYMFLLYGGLAAFAILVLSYLVEERSMVRPVVVNT